MTSYQVPIFDRHLPNPIHGEQSFQSIESLNYDLSNSEGNDNGERFDEQISNGRQKVARYSLSSDQSTAMLSNFSTAYNAVSISLVLPILQSPSLYNEAVTPTSESFCASSLLGGMMIGQLIGGALGDVIGRWNAMYLVMGIQILGTFGSALLVWDYGGVNIFDQLAAWRFVLGIGCGGVYPLAAALSAEQKSSSQSTTCSSVHYMDTEESSFIQREKLQKLALTFSTQGIGFTMVPIVTYPLLYFLGPYRLDYIWRIVLGVGALPGFFLAYLRFRWRVSNNDEKLGFDSIHITEQSSLIGSPTDVTQFSGGYTGNDNKMILQEVEESLKDWVNDSVEKKHITSSTEDDISSRGFLQNKGDERDCNSDRSLWNSIRCEENLFPKLCGTAFSWFLFDVVFYGNTLFQPIVIEAAFGSRKNDDIKDTEDNFQLLFEACRDSLFLTLMALPGYFVTIAVIGRKVCGSVRQTPKYIQTQGFLLMAALYTIIGLNWGSLKNFQWLLVSLYGSTFFFANYGPNTTTFLLPSLTYSNHCRTTLNGISAACGKAGAVVGASMFTPLTESLGNGSVMLICAFFSFLAALLTVSL